MLRRSRSGGLDTPTGSDVEDGGLSSGDDHSEHGPFVVPLEETMMEAAPSSGGSFPRSPKANTQSTAAISSFLSKLNGKKVISSAMFTFIFLIIWDSMFSKPENRLLKPDFSQHFLSWVQYHPLQGLIWILVIMSIAVIFMIPIGTPITLGCGYIYKGAYGWGYGVLVATIVSMAGSAVGAVISFLLGRYLMRDTVRKWIRKYPLFDAIDAASAEHGLRIMAMLYLTPILPLGPVSYMCGTTSMSLHHFVLAKIAALPLMMLYVFIGASTGTLIDAKKPNKDVVMSQDQVKSIEENETLIVAGILLSFVSIAVITHVIRQELNKILERQKRQQHETLDGNGTNSDHAGVETDNHHLDVSMRTTSATTATLEMAAATTARQRQRKH